MTIDANAVNRVNVAGRTFGISVDSVGTVRSKRPTDGSGPLVGSSAYLEIDGQVSERVTVPRVLAIGIAAFATSMKKREDNRRCAIVIEGTGYHIWVPVPQAEIEQAERFAIAFNGAAR